MYKNDLYSAHGLRAFSNVMCGTYTYGYIPCNGDLCDSCTIIIYLKRQLSETSMKNQQKYITHSAADVPA